MGLAQEHSLQSLFSPINFGFEYAETFPVWSDGRDLLCLSLWGVYQMQLPVGKVGKHIGEECLVRKTDELTPHPSPKPHLSSCCHDSGKLGPSHKFSLARSLLTLQIDVNLAKENCRENCY